MNFKQWLEVNFEEGDEFDVFVNKKYLDQPYLTIPGWGFIKLFYTESGIKPHWSVHMIKGEKPGAGTLLYFAALMWVLTDGETLLKSTKHDVTYGMLSSDTSLTSDALRARKRMEQQYGDYLYVVPEADTTMWRLKKMPPFSFKFSNG